MFDPLNEFEGHSENKADFALRDGLERLPVPDISMDFDAKIHAALRINTPWWRTLFIEARPTLSMAACSLVVTFVVLKVLTASTTDPRRFIRSAANVDIAVTRDKAEYRNLARMEALDNIDVANTTLSGFATLRRPASAR